MSNLNQPYNLGNIKIEEIIKGIVPIPKKSNVGTMEIIKGVKSELSLDASGEDKGLIYIFGREGKYLHQRVYDTNSGKIIEQDLFKKGYADSELSDEFITGGLLSFTLSSLYFILSSAGAESTNTITISMLDAYILSATFFGPLTPGIIKSINSLRPSVRRRNRKTSEYNNLVSNFRRENISDLEKTADHIRLFQGDVGEVSEELKRDLVRVDTGLPETYLCTKNTLELRIRTYLMGADAIVHYQPGSSIGTPVKYK